MFSFHGYSSRVIKAKRATGEYTQRIPLWRAETRDNASAERQRWMKLLSAGWARGAAGGAPRQLLLLANLAACTHSAPAHTRAPDKHQELAGRGQGASSATLGRGCLQPAGAMTGERPGGKSSSIPCCTSRAVSKGTQSAKAAAEPPFTVTMGEKQNSNRNPQKNTSRKSEQAGHLHRDWGRCGLPPEQSSAERHN